MADQAYTPNAEEAAVAAQWREKTAAAAQALNLTEEQAAQAENMSPDELVAALLYQRDQAAETA